MFLLNFLLDGSAIVDLLPMRCEMTFLWVIMWTYYCSSVCPLLSSISYAALCLALSISIQPTINTIPKISFHCQ